MTVEANREIVPVTAFSDLTFYIPVQANLNGRLKSKAVSNFGVESKEKIFNVKVYDTLQIDSGDSYTGRPNRPVTVEGTVNTNAYRGATFNYEWRQKEPEGKVFASGVNPRAEFSHIGEGAHRLEFAVTVTTTENLVLTGSKDAIVHLEAGVPTAFPGGPYRGGIADGNFSPIAFQGNNPGFIEAEDIGRIVAWKWSFDEPGNALRFDKNAHIQLNRPVNLGGEWTIAAWFETPFPQDMNTLVHGAQDRQIVVENRKLGTYDGAKADFKESGFELTNAHLLDGLHHVVAVGSNEGSTIFYIDGKKVGESDFKSTDNVIVIGNSRDGQQPFGFVDEVVIFNRALDLEGVKEVFTG